MWKLQIQPQYASRGLWEELAAKEGFAYEVLELSMPPALTAGSGYESCRQWYIESGRAVSVHGAFIDVNPASSDDAFRDLSMQRCHESCAMAKALGAKNIIFHSSCETYLRGAYLDEWAGRSASFYEMLPDLYDLQVWIENSRDADAVPISELMKRISNPRIGVCLDLGHVNFSRMPMEQWFETLGDRIGYLHLSDNNGLSDDHLPLGEGTVDWALADALWKNTGRNMPITLEVGGVEGVRSSAAYLKEYGYFGL